MYLNLKSLGLNKVNALYPTWRIYLISALIILFFLRLALPQFIKYILFPLLALAGILAIVELARGKFFKKKEFRYQLFLPVILLSGFYIAPFVFTINKQDMLVRDFVNVVAFFSFVFSVLFLINSKDELASVLNISKNALIITSTIVSLLGLVKLYFQLMGTKFQFLYVENLGYPAGATLAIDNNFFTLVCLSGIILSLPLLFKKNNFSKKTIIQVSLYLLLINIFLSTSRRGIILAITILLVFVIIWILSIVLKNEKIIQFRKNTIGFGFFSLLTISIIVYVIIVPSPFERNKKLSFSKFNMREVHTYMNFAKRIISCCARMEKEQ